jgi:hypothetical protein
MLVMLIETAIVGCKLLLEEISELILELLKSTLAIKCVVSRTSWLCLYLSGLRVVYYLKLGRLARFGCLLVQL